MESILQYFIVTFLSVYIYISYYVIEYWVRNVTLIMYAKI